MAKSKYEQLIDGVGIALDLTRAGNTKIKLACCHCGLVHLMAFSVGTKHLGFGVKQIPRATAQRRNMLKRKKLGVFAEKAKK